MRGFGWMIGLILLAGCASDDLSWISIRNETPTPIYIQPYSSDYTDGAWIQPGVSDDFYAINGDVLDGFTYFSLYYDSLIVYLKDYDDKPVKFYQDGTTINYDPTLNPFTNPDVWKSHEFKQQLSGTPPTMDEKNIFEHYFTIDAASVKYLSDTILQELNPA